MEGTIDRTARIVVIEDQDILAGALQVALPQRGDFRVVATASTLAEGVDAVRATGPDAVVSDYRLPDGDVPDHLPALRSGGAAVLVFSAWADETSLVRAMGAGAAGYLEKSSSFDDLVDALRRVLAGETVLSSRHVRMLSDRATAKVAEVTPRELEVLQLLAEGRSTTQIAEHLILAENTVRNVVNRVLPKLGARSRLEAVRIAVERGLIRYDPSADR